MNANRTHVGIIAAMPGELTPLVQGWKRLPQTPRGSQAWQGTLGETQITAVCSGMGEHAAERACSLAAQTPLDALISVGWAGALSCGMLPATAYVVNEVVEASTGHRFATRSTPDDVPAALKLVTLDHVATTPAEKRAIGIKFRAVLVDMEAATVARFARAHSLPFYCVKAVSDVQAETLPDFSRFTDSEGHLRLPSLLAHVATRPRYWPALARIGQNGRRGAEELKAILIPLLAPLPRVQARAEA